MTKPQAAEYASFFKRYIQLVPDGDYLQVLQQNTQTVRDFFLSIDKQKHNYRYEPGKWSVREMVLHISDTERVMSYRALTISRGDTEAQLPTMDEQVFAQHADVRDRSMEDLVDEFLTVRKASVYLFENMAEENSKFSGSVMGNIITPRALGYIIVGHTMHHMNVARERYLK